METEAFNISEGSLNLAMKMPKIIRKSLFKGLSNSLHQTLNNIRPNNPGVRMNSQIIQSKAKRRNKSNLNEMSKQKSIIKVSRHTSIFIYIFLLLFIVFFFGSHKYLKK